MRSSAISSASPDAPTPRSPHRRFALDGPSRPLDPIRDAARADLADIRLAGRIFAPHYAEALPRQIVRDVDLRDQAGTTLATLAEGATFEVLEIGRDLAWGVAPAQQRVGYVPVSAIRS